MIVPRAGPATGVVDPRCGVGHFFAFLLARKATEIAAYYGVTLVDPADEFNAARASSTFIEDAYRRAVSATLSQLDVKE